MRQMLRSRKAIQTKCINVMIVVNNGDILRLWEPINFGIILVKIRTFAIGGFNAVDSQ